MFGWVQRLKISTGRRSGYQRFCNMQLQCYLYRLNHSLARWIFIIFSLRSHMGDD